MSIAARIEEAKVADSSHVSGLARWRVKFRADSIDVFDETMCVTVRYRWEQNAVYFDDLPAARLPSLGCGGVAALCEGLFANLPDVERMFFPADLDDGLYRDLICAGLVEREDNTAVVRAGQFYQLAPYWLQNAGQEPFPLRYTSTNGRRHPVRRPGLPGVVYARRIPWLDTVLRFERVDCERHLSLFHKWMNDPRVDAFWEEAGDLNRHRSYLAARTANPGTDPLIGFLGEEPFGYFELYWAREDRLGEHYDAWDFDRGWHVAIGEGAFRGKEFITAWLPSLMHYMFLDDPRTMRIVGEPDARHKQQIRNLVRSGFAGLKHVDFPHKRSLMVMLLRERFFADRLWVPDFLRSSAAG